MTRFRPSLLALTFLLAILSLPPGSVATAQGSAVLSITLRGCAEGIDPHLVNPATDCSVPLDAPADAGAIWGGDGQGGMEIVGLDRQHNGAYVYRAGSPVMSVQLSGLAPVVRDAYQVIGYDSVSGNRHTITLTPGETRDIHIFYFYDQN